MNVIVDRECAALGLKQCSVCKNVLHSICSKATCKTDSAWPIMILPAKHNVNKISKQLFDEEDNVSSDPVRSDDSYEEEKEVQIWG